MKILLFAILLFSPFALHAQCVVPSGFVCITQDAANKISADLAELKESRTVIEAFKTERILNATQQKAADALIASLNNLVTVQTKVITDYDGVLKSMQKVYEAQAVLIEKLTTALNKPKSKWQQFVAIITRIGDIALGIAVGRLF